MEEKQKAPKNRTLQLEKEEITELKKRLFTISSKIITPESILNKTIIGDLIEIIDFLPESFADLIIIDPPYNISKDFAGMRFSKMDDKSYEEYLESWFPKIVKLLKPSGSLYICGDWKCTATLYTVMKKYLLIENRITWQREKGKGSKYNWKNSMEDIWFGVKNRSNHYFNIDAVKIKRKVNAPYYSANKEPKDWEDTPDGKFRITYPSNFWDDITVPYWSMPENTDHPTQKPEKLIAKLIMASCPPGGVVFDPFLGSGTTSVTAKKLGRQYCGVEINPEYCCLTEKRLEKASSDNYIQGYEDGIFWERNSIHKRPKTTSGIPNKDSDNLS